MKRRCNITPILGTIQDIIGKTERIERIIVLEDPNQNEIIVETVAEGTLALPLNEEIEVTINCVHIPGGLFDVYPSDEPNSDVSDPFSTIQTLELEINKRSECYICIYLALSKTVSA